MKERIHIYLTDKYDKIFDKFKIVTIWCICLAPLVWLIGGGKNDLGFWHKAGIGIALFGGVISIILLISYSIICVIDLITFILRKVKRKRQLH